MALDLGDGGGAGASVPAKKRKLQPLNYAPIAAWALNQGNGGEKSDRTGNGHTFGAPYFNYMIDCAAPVEGMRAQGFNGITAYNAAPLALTGSNALNVQALCASGFSMCGWVQRFGGAANGYTEMWALGFYTDYASLIPLYFPADMGDTGIAGRVQFWGNATAAIASSFKAIMGNWHWWGCSCPPGADSTITLQWDDQFADFPNIGIAATPWVPTPMGLGAATFSSNYGRHFAGALFDLMVWDKPLTRAQMKSQRAKALGG